MRCLYKVESKRRILSIENNRLTLSGSRTSISSLSSSLIKFFQAEKEANQKQEYNIEGRQFKHRAKSSLNLNSKVWRSHRKSGNQKEGRIKMNQYGIQKPNTKKTQTILRQKNILNLGQRECMRGQKYQTGKSNEVGKKQNEWRGRTKWKTNAGENNPYFNFTFGTRQLSPNSLCTQKTAKKINK